MGFWAFLSLISPRYIGWGKDGVFWCIMGLFIYCEGPAYPAIYLSQRVSCFMFYVLFLNLVFVFLDSSGVGDANTKGP